METQFEKHLESRIIPLLDRDGVFKDVPVLDYQLRGGFFAEHGDEAYRRLKKILDHSDYDKIRDAGFKFEKGDGFNVIPGEAPPFIK